MADFKYLGLTTYVTETPETNEKLVVLSEAIDVLQSAVPRVMVHRENFENVVQSADYQFITDNDSVCYIREEELPNNTPAEYQNPVIEYVTVKGVELIRLYIPTVAKNEDKLKDFQNALRSVLVALFGNEIASMKSRSSIEYENFADGKDEVLISVERGRK